jgi:hypothetical protein
LAERYAKEETMSNVNVGFATPAAIRGQSGDDLLGQTLDRIPFSV